MNDVRVRPIRSYTGHIQVYAVEVRRPSGVWREVAAFSSWDRAHNHANRQARTIRNYRHMHPAVKFLNRRLA